MAAAVPITPEQIWKLETNHEEWLLRQRQRETEAILPTRDAILAQMIATCMTLYYVCLCLSVCHKSCSIETDERIELVFGVVAFFHLFYAVLNGNSGISKIRALLSGTLSQTPDLKKFCFGISIVDTCCRLSSTKVDAQSMVNWAVVGQLS